MDALPALPLPFSVRSFAALFAVCGRSGVAVTLSGYARNRLGEPFAPCGFPSLAQKQIKTINRVVFAYRSKRHSTMPVLAIKAHARYAARQAAAFTAKLRHTPLALPAVRHSAVPGFLAGGFAMSHFASFLVSFCFALACRQGSPVCVSCCVSARRAARRACWHAASWGLGARFSLSAWACLVCVPAAPRFSRQGFARAVLVARLASLPAVC